MVTRKPPRTPCKMTAASAAAPRNRTQWRESTRHIQTARMMVRKPTTDAVNRWVCSKKMPPTHLENGKRNMLYPKVVGQSGTASPTPLLVTIPPLQIKKRVAAAVNQAKRFSQTSAFPSDTE